MQPGKCWHLFPRAKFESELIPFQLPEILRTPLESMCLQVRWFVGGWAVGGGLGKSEAVADLIVFLTCVLVHLHDRCARCGVWRGRGPVAWASS